MPDANVKDDVKANNVFRHISAYCLKKLWLGASRSIAWMSDANVNDDFKVFRRISTYSFQQTGN